MCSGDSGAPVDADAADVLTLTPSGLGCVPLATLPHPCRKRAFLISDHATAVENEQQPPGQTSSGLLVCPDDAAATSSRAGPEETQQPEREILTLPL
jgi:hypothetical protein